MKLDNISNIYTSNTNLNLFTSKIVTVSTQTSCARKQYYTLTSTTTYYLHLIRDNQKVLKSCGQCRSRNWELPPCILIWWYIQSMPIAYLAACEPYSEHSRPHHIYMYISYILHGPYPLDKINQSPSIAPMQSNEFG